MPAFERTTHTQMPYSHPIPTSRDQSSVVWLLAVQAIVLDSHSWSSRLACVVVESRARYAGISLGLPVKLRLNFDFAFPLPHSLGLRDNYHSCISRIRNHRDPWMCWGRGVERTAE